MAKKRCPLMSIGDKSNKIGAREDKDMTDINEYLDGKKRSQLIGIDD